MVRIESRGFGNHFVSGREYGLCSLFLPKGQVKKTVVALARA